MRATDISATWSQTRFELRSQLANGEQQLLNLLLPIAALWVVSRTGSSAKLVQLVLIGAVFASNFTGTAIATAFERRQGVLKALSVTPLGKLGVVSARIATGVLLGVCQLVLLAFAATGFGLPVDLASGWWLLIPLLAATSQGWALTLASGLRAEAVLAMANSLLVLATLYAILQSGSIWWQAVNPLGLAWHANDAPLFSAIGLVVHSIVAISVAVRAWRWD